MFAPAAFNQTGRDYLLSANDNVMICVQIESRKAVENVEDIAKVDGIGKYVASTWADSARLTQILLRHALHWAQRSGFVHGIRCFRPCLGTRGPGGIFPDFKSDT